MNSDELEQRLARVPIGSPPPAWRAEILAAARTARGVAAAAGRNPNTIRASTPVPSRGWWAEIFGSGPSPWTVPAGAFALVVLLNWSGSRLGGAELREPNRSTFSSRGQAVTAVREYQARVAAFARADEEGKDSEAARESPLHGPWLDPGSRPRSSVEPGGEARGRLRMSRMG